MLRYVNTGQQYRERREDFRNWDKYKNRGGEIAWQSVGKIRKDSLERHLHSKKQNGLTSAVLNAADRKIRLLADTVGLGCTIPFLVKRQGRRSSSLQDHYESEEGD
ncbi:uncharacterized protein PGTG_02191 [Puccinia graminis f. sp. tritici CRL 75-36-700-3]|uniref:Uncharacterized protein n=1 Tax=Puccinia graminis f. sp. tritici (strain CRL 75-36-700-3 / race SCCL) TaxID=418459 RepID=E3JXF5_PUCGT|nr:uncharacterized protein PGTG_02191 [Puccinia graminis f. sp. tritici CRL 75-36-700-3]EFP76730.1 hypothetical protein PGTG_02191 [Puccinia graminis f. sp. tritici CRL 75-36-700-3]